MEQACVFTRTGVVLWRETWHPLKGDPVNDLIHEVLLEERQHLRSFESQDQKYSLQWAQDNRLHLVFVVVLSKGLRDRMPYVPDLLKLFKKEFGKVYTQAASAGGVAVDKFHFGATFKALLKRAKEKHADKVRAGPQAVADDTDSSGDDGGEEEPVGAVPAPEPAPSTAPESPAPAAAERADEAATPAAGDSSGDDSSDDGGEAGAEPEAEPSTPKPPSNALLDLLTKRTGGGRRGGRGGRGGGRAAKTPTPKTSSPKRRGKVMARSNKVTEEELSKLDRSAAGAGDGDTRSRVDMVGIGSDTINFDSDSDEEEESKSGGWFARTRIGGLFASLSGNRVLTGEDVREPLAALAEQLMAKNVAKEVADALCASVETSLVGKKVERFTTVGGAVKAALRSAIERILTPKTSTDLLLKVKEKARTSDDPFVIVFIGVNGVGKSTSLSKVTYLLKENHHNPIIAACDTFRSGAVEQLGVHSRNLDVPLYERGYERDPANVARDAIKKAKEDGHDVVMVDTAGRMQNNAPLMAALANLVALNKPDLVLFVGEALVGNDGIDQLSLFNQALIDHSPVGETPRRIDGIILTKFDTIDDKVGAALSMVYRTGQPIMFVGTGQKYTNLHPLNVGFVVKCLLS